MKNKILSIGFILSLILMVFMLTGCDSDKKSVSEEESKQTTINDELIGTWSLNNQINSSDKDKYSSLRRIFGDSLNSVANSLVLNSDNTFRLNVGAFYYCNGNYEVMDNTIHFSNIEDVNRYDEDEMEINLKAEKIEYNGNTLLQMKVYDITDADVYIYFNKSGTNNNIEIPPMTFENNTQTTDETNDEIKTEEIENNISSNNQTDAEGIKVGEYKLKYGTYIGYYTTTQTESIADAYQAEIKIKINNDGTISSWEDVLGDWIVYDYKIQGNTIKLIDSTMEFVVKSNTTLSWGEIILEYQE